MDKISWATFNRITAKEQAALTSTEIEFLKARTSYLTPEQKDYFRDIFMPKGEDYKELQRQAKELGLKAVGVNRKDLEEVIQKAKNES